MNKMNVMKLTIQNKGVVLVSYTINVIRVKTNMHLANKTKLTVVHYSLHNHIKYN